MTTQTRRSRAVGFSIGALVYAGVSAAWVLIAALAGELASALAITSSAGILVLAIAAGLMLRNARRLAEEPPTELQEEWQRRAGKWFGGIFAAEGVAIGVGSGIAAATGNTEWIPAITAFIVGLHFIPLGRILEIKADYWLGGLIIVSTGVVAWWGRDNSPELQATIIGMTTAALLWLAGWVRLNEARSTLVDAVSSDAQPDSLAVDGLEI